MRSGGSCFGIYTLMKESSTERDTKTVLLTSWGCKSFCKAGIMPTYVLILFAKAYMFHRAEVLCMTSWVS